MFLSRTYFIYSVAVRFRQQIFLSVDVPPMFAGMDQSSRLLVTMEKAIVDTLKGVEERVINESM
jgi:hypothetical protein